MGAYFATKAFNKQGEIVTTFETFDLARIVEQSKIKNEYISFGGLKFLEANYIWNLYVQTVLFFLKEKSNKDNPYIINTVCDYDEREDFVHFDQWGENEFFSTSPNEDLTQKDINVISGFLKQIYVYREGEKTQNGLSFEEVVNQHYINNGFLVNSKTKEYIDLSFFYKKQNETTEHSIFSPLAILTRAGKVYMGGGDIDFEDPEWFKHDFLENPDFDLNLVASWKDTPIYYTSSLTEEEKDFKDISLNLFCETCY